jgi:two-component system OmpR family sensor kinase
VVVEAQDAGTGHAVSLATCQPTEVLGDAERLRQVLRNVVGNALRHTPPRTRVNLALWRVDSVAELRVQDDGPGITPEHLPHLFERFYRAEIARPRAVDDDTVGASSGAGLGLAIAKHIVEAHGGSIAAESAAGAGLVIRLRLPIAPRGAS